METDPELGPLLAKHADIDREVLAETAQASQRRRRRTSSCGADSCRPAWQEIEATYQRLGVTFDHTLGESFYHDRLRGVVKDLADKGFARESEGAICVFIEGQPAPMIVQKQDGAFLYATTDLATIQYRMAEWHPDAILYVVDHRQSLHFEQLFAAARLWGYRECRAPAHQLRHRARRRRPAIQDAQRHFGRPDGTARRSGRPRVRDRLPKRRCPTRRRCSPRKIAARSPSESASARSNTPTSPTTARATTSSATTRCSP